MNRTRRAASRSSFSAGARPSTHKAAAGIAWSGAARRFGVACLRLVDDAGVSGEGACTGVGRRGALPAGNIVCQRDCSRRTVLATASIVALLAAGCPSGPPGLPPCTCSELDPLPTSSASLLLSVRLFFFRSFHVVWPSIFVFFLTVSFAGRFVVVCGSEF